PRAHACWRAMVELWSQMSEGGIRLVARAADRTLSDEPDHAREATRPGYRLTTRPPARRFRLRQSRRSQRSQHRRLPRSLRPSADEHIHGPARSPIRVKRSSLNVATIRMAAMAAPGVRSRSLPFAHPARSRCKHKFRRTIANGCERLPAFAMQKVEGSNPFI